jgi:transcriptional regulator of acetoin/glycerol metabolism
MGAWMTGEQDLIQDIITRLLALMPPEARRQIEPQVRAVEMEIRRDWATERVYISLDPYRDERMERAAVKLAAGVDRNEVQQEAGISRATLYRLIKKSADESAATNR